MNTDSPDDQRLQAALAALQATRAALRRELLPDEACAAAERDRNGHGATGGAVGGNSSGLNGWRWWRRLRRSARRSPWINLATQSALRWWQQQPWHESSRLLSREVLAQGRPLVRRHPVAAVAVGALAGAALVASKPWRWRWVQQPLRAVPVQAGSWLVAQLSSASVQAALAGLLIGSLGAANGDQTPAGGDARGPPEPGTAAMKSGTAGGASAP